MNDEMKNENDGSVEDRIEKMPPNAVIIDVRPTDFIAGAANEVNVGAVPLMEPAGQYDNFLPTEETQYDYRFDTSACVSFSAVNDIEVALTWLIAHNRITAKNIQWLKDKGYIDYRTGKVNFSDRFTAKMSGTSKAGNSLGAVGDSMRNHGLVPESIWPWPEGMIENPDYFDRNWSTYYAEIPQSVKDLGLAFKSRFEILYQWVLLGDSSKAEAMFKKFLPYGSIQIAALVCAPWNSTEGMPPIKGCGCGTQHATIIYGYNDKISWKDFDHYRSFKKLLDWEYCIPYAVQHYIAERATSKPTVPSANISYGAKDSTAVRQLQTCLQYLGYMKAGVYGPFGPQTREALDAFQTSRGIIDPDGQGMNFGPKTRVAMTLAITNK